MRLQQIQALDPDRANFILGEIRRLRAEVECTFVEIGKLCLEVREHKLYIGYGYPDFRAFMLGELDRRKSTIYMAIRSVKELTGTVEEADLRKMTLTNADILARAPTSKRRELVPQAQTLSGPAFLKVVEQVSGPLHIEDQEQGHIEMWTDKSLADRFHEDVAAAAKMEESESQAVGLERILTDWENSCRVMDGVCFDVVDGPEPMEGKA